MPLRPHSPQAAAAVAPAAARPAPEAAPPGAAHRPLLTGVRIAVDGYNLALPKGTGVATYARTLTHCLHALGAQVDILYGRRVVLEKAAVMREIAFLDPEGVSPKRWRRRLGQWLGAATAPFGRRAEQITLAGAVATRDIAATLPYFDRIMVVPDMVHTAMRHFSRWGAFLNVRVAQPPAIMHWTYPLPIHLVGSRNIYTIHDLVPLRLPFATLDDKVYYHRLIRACVQRAAHICTISQNSRNDIQHLFGLGDDRLTVTYQAVSDRAPGTAAERQGARDCVEQVYGFDWQGYFLFFGAIEPKKNVGRLLQAALDARAQRPLIIVGDAAWKAAEEVGFLADYERAIAVTGAPRRLHKFSYLPAAHLNALVLGARAVLFPSLYEGFGLPVLEAMQMGTPVLTSSEGAMPEIAGDAALLVDPYDVDALAAAIGRLDRDDGLIAELSRRGPAQAAKFGLTPYLDRLERLYTQVLNTDPA